MTNPAWYSTESSGPRWMLVMGISLSLGWTFGALYHDCLSMILIPNFLASGGCRAALHVLLNTCILSTQILVSRIRFLYEKLEYHGESRSVPISDARSG